MNTNPDEMKLALWLDDELHGEELAAFEVWALQHPEHVAAREELRVWRKQIAAVIPAVAEVPHADFFNHKIAQAIRSQASPPPQVKGITRPFWKSWLIPASAFAGMVFAFWLGTKAGSPTSMPVISASQPVVYTPDGDVAAEWVSGTHASVIVLKGVSAIPDSTDFSQTVYVPTERDIDSTAVRENMPITPNP